MSTWLAAATALAAITATYFFCVRPGMRGRCPASGAGASGGSSAANSNAELDRQLEELREEVRMLHAQDMLDTGQVPHPPPPSDS
jgi:K+-transporting ATPase c subunit